MYMHKYVNVCDSMFEYVNVHVCMLASCPRTINSETLEVGLAICVLTSPPDDSGVGSCLRAIALQAQIRVRDFC